MKNYRKSLIAGLLFSAALALVAAKFGPSTSADADYSSDSTDGVAVYHEMVSDGLRLVVAPEGNMARYRVREQLVGLNFPNDAVGETAAVSGLIVIDADGAVSQESKIIINVADLRTDSDRRDNFVRRNTLQTEEFPDVELVPLELRGFPLPVPTEGATTFDVVGDLTIRGVTRPTTWNVIARFHDGHLTGTAETSFTFSDFDITVPSVRSVLSVAETIRLEYEFTLLIDAAAGS